MPNTLKIQGSMKVQGGLYITTIISPTTLIWSGLGINNNWSTTTNWNLRTPINFDILQFAGTTRLTPFNDLAVDTNLNGVAFNAGAGAFAISGNRFILNTGDITNNSSNTQQINNDIVLASDVVNITCNTAAINLNGNISGTGTLTKTGLSGLSLSGNNSYTGNTFISAGPLVIGNSNPFGTGDVFLASTAGALTVATNSIPSTVVINNRLNFVSNSVINFNRSTTLNGPINFTGGSVTLNGPLNSIVTFNNTISASTGVSTFFPFAQGQMIFNAPVIFSGQLGGQGFQAHNGGVFTFNATGNKLNVLNGRGALFVCGVSNAFSQYLTDISLGRRTTTQSYGQVNLNGTDQVFRSIRNTTTSFSDCSGCNIFNNSSTFSNLTTNDLSVNVTYTGSISGNINLIKTGTGTLILSGSTDLAVGPRYTGFTAISAGTLTIRALSSNPSNKVDFASFTNTTLTVNFTTPPIAGDSFILLPARTINLYPAVTLQNASGRTGTYNSTNSTLSIT